MSKKLEKRGRPAKDADEVRSELIKIRVTKAEKEIIQDAAVKHNKSVTTWIRDAIRFRLKRGK